MKRHRRHRMTALLIAIAAATVLAGCGGEDVTVEPEEAATVAELDAAVQAAARSLLDSEAVPIAVVTFSWEDREQITRYEWVDYRPDREVLAVYRSLTGNATTGLSRTNEGWAVASVSDDETYPWTTDSELGLIDEAVPAVGQLVAMTTQETGEFTEHDPSLRHQVTRQRASDGSELWSLIVPADSEEIMMTQQWIVNGNGKLQFYRVFAEQLVFSPTVGTIVYEYGVIDEDTEPIIVPELGTPLRLDELGIPEALRDLEE